MKELKETGQYALNALISAGAYCAQVSVSSGETEEFNVDAGEFSLIRSVFSSGISIKAIKDKKRVRRESISWTENRLTPPLPSA